MSSLLKMQPLCAAGNAKTSFRSAFIWLTLLANFGVSRDVTSIHTTVVNVTEQHFHLERINNIHYVGIFNEMLKSASF